MGTRLESKIAVVTGAASGIGRAIAIAMAHEGAVVVIGDLRRDPLEGGQPTDIVIIEECAGRARHVPCDVRRAEDVAVLLSTTLAEYGGIDIMVNNAGIIATTVPSIEKPLDQWQDMIQVHLLGTWFGCREAIPIMVRQGRGGKVINISSRLASAAGGPGRADYAAAKGAILSLTRQLAAECGRFGINVNAIAPGFVPTKGTERLGSEKVAETRRRTPYPRLGRPEDVAACAVFLASQESDFIQGQCIAVDGGVSILA